MRPNIIPLPQADTLPTISVIMVSYMTGPALFDAVQSVLNDRDIFELVLIDNGNPENTRQRLCQQVAHDDRVRLYQGHGNIGFSKGCNYAAQFARGDYLLFLNPDAVLMPGTARKLAKQGQLQSQTKPWVIGGMLRNIDGQEQRGCRRRALTPLRALTTFSGLSALPFLSSVHMDNEPLPLGPTRVDIVSGACMMMSREAFQALGGFDERYFLHVEDIDICREVWAQGGDVVFHPDAKAMHYGSTSRVPRIRVEMEKLKGFMIYFWKSADTLWKKAINVFAWPFMAVAIIGRAYFLALRQAFTGR